MRIRIAVPEAFASPDVIDAALEAVTRLDEHMIRAGQTPTSRELVTAGAIWRPENLGDEHFDHGGTIASRGWGDCDDWAPLHAATLRASGEDTSAVARVVPSGPNTYHAIVQRSDGTIDDPSIAAGMKAKRVGGIDDRTISVRAVDPHDGRVYEGQLAPTVGPLAVHAGPAIGMRSAHVVGSGLLYEARCDLPMVGSPLVHVHSYWRRHPRRHVRAGGAVTVIGGAAPYAFSCSSRHPSPLHAMSDAITGAILCGDAAEMSTSLDRYKLLALQAALSGLSPGQVRAALQNQMVIDVHAQAEATGVDPAELTQRMVHELAVQGYGTGCIVGDLWSDIGHMAGSVVSAISDGANTIAKAAGSIPWGDIVHGAQAAVSVVPVLGTAVSDVVAAAESAYDVAAAALSGDPLGGAIHAAYNFALSNVPGAPALHVILDPVLNTLLNLAQRGEPIDTAVLNGVLSAVPDAPKFGPISPRTIAASLAAMVTGHLGLQHNTVGKPGPPGPPSQLAAQLFGGGSAASKLAHATAKVAPPNAPGIKNRAHISPAAAARNQARLSAAAKPPPPVIPIHLAAALPKPPGVPHAAIHHAFAPAAHAAAAAPLPAMAPAPMAPPPMATPVMPPPPPRARGGSPGAPPGATHWTCSPGPGGTWQCRWI